MPVSIDNPTVDLITAGVWAGFDAAKESMRTKRPKAYRKITVEPVEQGHVVVHDFFQSFGPMRKWVGEKQYRELAEHKFVGITDPYEASIEVRTRYLSERRAEAAGLNVGARLAGMGEDNNDKVAAAAIAAAATTLLAYDGVALLSDVTGARTFDNYDSGGGGQLWAIVCMEHGVGPLILQQSEDYGVKSQTSPESEPMFKRRSALYSLEGDMTILAGLPQTIYASKQTLNATNLNAAVEAMAGFTDETGEPLGLIPTHLVVGRSNWAEGRDLMKAEMLSNSSNTLAGMFELVYWPRLA